MPEGVRPGNAAKSPRSSVSLPPDIVATSGKAIHDALPIQSLDRGLAILEAVAASPHPVPLKQLTDLIGIDRSSVFRLVNTLRQRRFLANPKGSRDYVLGPTSWRLSLRYGRNALGMFFHHQLEELTATLGETSHFTIREGVEVFFVDHQIPTGQVVSVAGQTGQFAPLHCTAHGKALLADCDLSALRDLLGSGRLPVHTRTTVRSVTALARACAEVRAVGFAFDDGEYIAEVRCVAAPIRDPEGDIVASVGISSPVSRLQTRGVARAAAEVKKTLRVVGDPRAKVSRIQLGVGYATPAANVPDVDVVISGEQQEADGFLDAPEYVADAAALRLPRGWIMLGHNVSEEAGMLEMAQWIEKLVPKLPVQLIKSGEPFWAPK